MNASAIALAVASALVTPVGAARAEDALPILRSMRPAADGLTDYTMLLVKQERRGDRLEPEQTFLVKWARPQRTYFKALDGPQKGQEVLYVQGRNRDRLKAHKGSFPDITMSLDPHGSWAMAHTHHPVDEVGIPRFVAIVLENVERGLREGKGSTRYRGEDTVWSRPCFRVELVSPPDGKTHVMQPGETLWDVARRYGQSMHVLLHSNRRRKWRGPKDPRPGDEVFVPEFYAGRVDLWVDRELRLPIRALIYDHHGLLYECYEHRDLRVNVGLSDRDFDPANPEYDF